jgi:hypothetical protein
MIPYILSSSLGDLWRGVLVTPQGRVQGVRYDLPPQWITLVPSLAYGIVVFPYTNIERRRFKAEYLVAFIAGLSAMVLMSAELIPYQGVWNLARHLNIVAVAAGAGLVNRAMQSDWPMSTALQRALLLVTVMAFTSLTEFPFAHPIYFVYTAPIVALTLLPVVRAETPARQRLHGVVAALLILFAVVRLNRQYVHQVGIYPARRYTVASSQVPRSGLRVAAPEQEVYTRVLDLVAAHARGRYVYAAPDCPEVYFLSGLRNPTRTFYELFDRPAMTADETLALIDRHGITVVVIDMVPEFSPGLDARTLDALAARFPRSAAAGKFIVRWAE